MMMSNLPMDLLEEILCRIPATSVMQLRSTCKQWNCLFNSGTFTKKHFDKAAKQFKILMLKESRVCSMSVNLHGVPSVELKGEHNLIDPCSNTLDQFKISRISHYDGLLLCTSFEDTRIVVWNPCTGQSRWIQPRKHYKTSECYALGSYIDNKTHDKSYKILSYSPDYGYKNESAIYEMNSNSWRILDATSDCHMVYLEYGVSLKGNSYWFGSYEKVGTNILGIFLFSFDYTTERYEHLGFPCECPRYETMSLSVVREEKIAVLLQCEYTTRTEIWVTNKIGETKVVSWSMVFAFDSSPELSLFLDVSFLLDEEKKIIVCCDDYLGDDEFDTTDLVHIVGEDNIKVIQLDFGVSETPSQPFMLNYVPSLTRIHQQG